MELIAKPECGIQLKINTSGIQNKYYTNIRMYNSEIFCYTMNKICNVVTLHSYQIMDPSGFGMRLSFSILKDVHEGMQAIHDFVRSFTNYPTLNRYMPNVKNIEELLYQSDQTIHKKISQSYNQSLPSVLSLKVYQDNINNHLPGYIRLSQVQVNHSIENAAKTIQLAWRKYTDAMNVQKVPNSSNPMLKSKL